jgi:signal transduction histidine kinase/CheY-like chemotaxis protein
MERVPILRRLLSGLSGRPADTAEAAADREWDREADRERFRALADALDRAESLNEAKSRFLALASHEIRTPLNGMLGLAALLQETELTPEQENFVRAIRASGGLLLGLVDDMLDLARIEAGHLEMEAAPANPAELVQDVVELLAVRAFARGVDIAAYAAPHVPTYVNIDGPRLRQVLVNLAGNAIKFTERGGVSVTLDYGAGHLTFAVADTGSGMDAATRARLSASSRIPVVPVSRPQHGAGLGLPIACEIVRRMGGEIEFAGRPAGGTLISFWIPVDARKAPVAAWSAPTRARRQCLLVAPEGFGADIAMRLLAEQGVDARQVDTQAHAAALLAAAAAAKSAYDFVLIDARVTTAPGETLAAIRDAAAMRLPAAIMVEPGNRKSVPMLRAAGFDAYLVRPLRRASLQRIVDGLLAGEAFRLDPADEKRPVGQLATAPACALSVLVVDDNEINALLLRVVMERLGHRVTECHDGRAAIAAAEREDFDIVFLDLNLPGLGGAAVAADLRRRAARPGKRPHLIAVTGDGVAAHEGAAEFDAVLGKPVTPEALRALLDRLNAPTAA